MTSEELLQLLKNNSPFKSSDEFAKILSFDSDGIIADNVRYSIHNISEGKDHYNIVPSHVLFPHNIKIQVESNKPVYINWDDRTDNIYLTPIEF